MTPEEMQETAVGRYCAWVMQRPMRSQFVVETHYLWDESGRRHKALLMWGGGGLLVRDDDGDPGDEG